jgi:DNA-directed RNA polymerase specialized sigma24 family protein
VCKRILGNLQDAEDALQATFVVLAHRAAKLSGEGSLSSWLYGVAYRIALNARRLAAHRRRHERQAHPMASTNPAADALARSQAPTRVAAVEVGAGRLYVAAASAPLTPRRLSRSGSAAAR